MRVLIIAAPMDDETIGMGGTIAKHVDRRDTVHICIVCKRAYDHKFQPELVETERASTLRAVAVLGCEPPTFLDLRDELLDERLLEVIVPVESCVAGIRPDVVYTNHRDSNQDHGAVFHACLIACRSIASPKVKRFLTYEVASSTDQAPPFPEYAFQPNFYVDISSFLERKVTALKAYARELREFPHQRSTKGVEDLAMKRGMEVGFAAAEAFMVVRDEWA